MTSDDNVKLELLLEDIRHLSHQCAVTSDKPSVKNAAGQNIQGTLQGYEDLFEQQSSNSFKIDGLELEEFKKRILSKQEEDKDRIQQLERDLQREQDKSDEYEAKNLEQSHLIEELETKLSFKSNGESQRPNNESSNEESTNDERNKTHTEIIIAHVRQQLEDLQSFVKVPEETYDTLRQEIETVRGHTEEVKQELASNEETCQKLRPLVRQVLLMNEDLEKASKESSDRINFLQTHNKQLQGSLGSYKTQNKQYEELGKKRQEELSRLGKQRKQLTEQVKEFEALWKETKEQRDRYDEANKELQEELFKHKSSIPLKPKPRSKSVRSIGMQTENTVPNYPDNDENFSNGQNENEEVRESTAPLASYSTCNLSQNQSVYEETHNVDSSPNHPLGTARESVGVFEFDYESEEEGL